MRKKFIIVLILTIIISCFSGCGTEKVIDKQPESVSDLSGCVVDLTKAQGLGIARQSALKERVSVDYNNQEETDKLVMIQKTESGYEEIRFQKEDNGFEITQDSADLEVYKLHVGQDFTFVAFISGKVRRDAQTEECKYNQIYPNEKDADLTIRCFPISLQDSGSETQLVDRLYAVPENFDDKNYMNNQYVHSYVIHNETGKVYKMDDFKYFHISDNMIYTESAWDERFYYDLSVNDKEELEVVEIVSNPDMKVEKIIDSKDGYRFIANDKVDFVDEDKKIVYFTNNHYFVDSLGNVFEEDNLKFNLLYKIENGKRNALSESENANDLKSISAHLQQSFFGIKNGYLLINSNLQSGDGQVIAIKDQVNIVIPNQYFFATLWIDQDTIILKENENYYWCQANWYSENQAEIISLPLKKLHLLTGANITSWTVIEDGVIHVYPSVFQEVTPTGTKYYTVVRNAQENPEIKLLQNTIAEKKILVIQPMN